jgi:hypothetical protein
VPLKAGEIMKVIETDGWYLIATRGSHRQYKHPDKPHISTLYGLVIRNRIRMYSRDDGGHWRSIAARSTGR